MRYRDGSTSTFSISGTGTVDQFPVLEPLDPYSYTHSSDSIVSSSTINKYFDATIKIQESLIKDVGSIVVSSFATADGPVTGTDLKVSYEYFTFDLTSNTHTVTGTVPSQYGTEPFHDLGFSMATTFHYNVGQNTNLSGVWKDLSVPSFGVTNSLLTQPQFFVSVSPTTTGTCSTCSAKIRNVPFHSSSLDFSTVLPFIDTFATAPINMQYDADYLSQLLNGNPFKSTGSGIQCVSTLGVTTTDGLLAVKNIRANNTSIQFGPVTVITTLPVSGLPYNRSGPALKITWNSSTNLASFYALSIGDVPYGSYTKTTARLLKVVDHDLSAYDADGSGTWFGSGTVTDMCAASGVTYPDVGNASYTSILFSVSGAVINLQYQTSPGSSWTSFSGFPIVDPTPLSGFTDGSLPYSGFFSKALRGTSPHQFSPAASNSVSIKGPVTVTNTDSVTSIPCALGVLYFSISEDVFNTPTYGFMDMVP